MVTAKAPFTILALLFASSFAIACSSSDHSQRGDSNVDDSPHPVDRSNWSEERMMLEEDFDTALLYSQRVLHPELSTDELSEELWVSFNKYDDLRNRLEKLSADGNTEQKAWAKLRTGQTFLATGCAAIHSPLPKELTPAQRVSYRELLYDHTIVFFETTREIFGSLQSSPRRFDDMEPDELQPWLDKARRWSVELSDFDDFDDLQAACDALDDAWHNSITYLETTCLDGDTDACDLLFHRVTGPEWIALRAAVCEVEPSYCEGLTDLVSTASTDRPQNLLEDAHTKCKGEYHTHIVDTLEEHCHPDDARNCDLLAAYFTERGDDPHSQGCRAYYQLLNLR